MKILQEENNSVSNKIKKEEIKTRSIYTIFFNNLIGFRKLRKLYNHLQIKFTTLKSNFKKQ